MEWHLNVSFIGTKSSLYSKQTIAATFPIQNVLFNINGGILMLTIIPFVTLKTENGSKKK
jgi:hypothetical protein